MTGDCHVHEEVYDAATGCHEWGCNTGLSRATRSPRAATTAGARRLEVGDGCGAAESGSFNGYTGSCTPSGSYACCCPRTRPAASTSPASRSSSWRLSPIQPPRQCWACQAGSSRWA